MWLTHFKHMMHKYETDYGKISVVINTPACNIPPTVVVAVIASLLETKTMLTMSSDAIIYWEAMMMGDLGWSSLIFRVVIQAGITKLARLS